MSTFDQVLSIPENLAKMVKIGPDQQIDLAYDQSLEALLHTARSSEWLGYMFRELEKYKRLLMLRNGDDPIPPLSEELQKFIRTEILLAQKLPNGEGRQIKEEEDEEDESGEVSLDQHWDNLTNSHRGRVSRPRTRPQQGGANEELDQDENETKEGEKDENEKGENNLEQGSNQSIVDNNPQSPPSNPVDDLIQKVDDALKKQNVDESEEDKNEGDENEGNENEEGENEGNENEGKRNEEAVSEETLEGMTKIPENEETSSKSDPINPPITLGDLGDDDENSEFSEEDEQSEGEDGNLERNENSKKQEEGEDANLEGDEDAGKQEEGEDENLKEAEDSGKQEEGENEGLEDEDSGKQGEGEDEKIGEGVEESQEVTLPPDTQPSRGQIAAGWQTRESFRGAGEAQVGAGEAQVGAGEDQVGAGRAMKAPYFEDESGVKHKVKKWVAGRGGYFFVLKGSDAKIKFITNSNVKRV